MIEPNLEIMIPLVGYLVLITIIGWWYGKKIKTTEDYYIGGYQIPGWVLALSERSTDMSAWLLIGMPAMAWATGLSAIWILVGTGAGMVLQWIFYSKKFMDEKRRTGAITPNDYIAKRFPGGADGIRIVGALVVFLFYIPYVGSQFGAGGTVLEQTFGLDPLYGTIIVAAVVGYIAVAGAMLTASYTDAVQALMMVVTLIVLPLILFSIVVSDPDMAIMASLEGVEYEGVALGSWFGGEEGAAVGLLFGVNLSWIWGYLGGQPHIFVRMMALRNESDRKKGMAVAFVWGLLTSVGAFLIGILARVIHGAPADLVENSEMTLPYMVLEHTPGWLGGLLLAGALAAMMSTADSQLAVASSGWAEDLYAKVLKKDVEINEKRKVMISRLTSAAIAILGLILILSTEELIYEVVGWGWAGLAGVYGPVMTLIFLGWKRYSKDAVIFTMVVGLLFTAIWVFTGLETEIITARLVSWPVGLLAGIIGGFIWPSEDFKKGEQMIEEEEEFGEEEFGEEEFEEEFGEEEFDEDLEEEEQLFEEEDEELDEF
ncbi:MAG: sodium/proline symporter [Candidatus Saliniplasma sp.]